jgi:hypothetical protein
VSDKATRRTALAILGLAPATALAAEDVRHRDIPDGGGRSYGFGASVPRTVAALRRLADEIERGDCLLQTMDMQSSAAFDAFLVHKLTVGFAVRDPA